MIFEILDFKKEEVTEEHRIVFENLACAYFEGKHIVFAELKVIKKILETTGLSSRALGSYRSIKNSITQFGEVFKTSKFKIQIDFDSKLKNVEVSHQQLTIPHKLLTDSDSFQKSFLLCENSSDSKVFFKLAKHFLVSKRWGNLDVKFEVANGGGAETYKEFNRIVELNPIRFCFCLLDSDKSHPNSSLGSTAVQFPEVIPYWNGKVRILDCHEMEILIPFKIFQETLYEDSNLQDPELVKGLELLCDLEEKYFKYVVFADIKEGMNCNEIAELERKYGVFWTNIKSKAFDEGLKNCLKRKKCCGESRKIFPKISKGLFEKAIKKLQNMTHQKISEMLPHDKEELWFKIGEDFFWWGCAPEKPLFT